MGAGERGVNGLAGPALPSSEIQGPSAQRGGLSALGGRTRCASTDGSEKEPGVSDTRPGRLSPSVVARGGYLVAVAACPMSACRSAVLCDPSQAPSESRVSWLSGLAWGATGTGQGSS